MKVSTIFFSFPSTKFWLSPRDLRQKPENGKDLNLDLNLFVSLFYLLVNPENTKCFKCQYSRLHYLSSLHFLDQHEEVPKIRI